MKIAILSLAIGDEYKKVVRYGIRGKKEWCEKQGYTYIDDEKGIVDKTRELQWAKIPLILKHLPLFDWIVWIDADTHITNFETKMENLIEALLIVNPNFQISYQKDPHGWINTGFMLIRGGESSDFSFSFFEEAYKHTDKICWEQGAIDFLYTQNWNDSQSRIFILEHSQGYNQYWFTHRKEDFMIHFAGSASKDALQKLMIKFCPFKMEEESEEEFKIRKNFNTEEEWKKSISNRTHLPMFVF